MTGEEIKTWRDARGLNQKELADLLGLNLMTVWRYENGKLPIPLVVELALETLARTVKPKRAKRSQ